MHPWEGLFSIQNDAEFERWALKIFTFQYENTPVYREYCDLIQKSNPKCLNEIPFLPISFFKTHEVKHKAMDVQLTFRSSGTSGMERATHWIQDPVMYISSFSRTYKSQIGDPEDQVILALLPNYIEQGESSLIYMVDQLIHQTKNELSGFLLDDVSSIENKYQKAIKQGKKVVIFGVSYALLDIAEKGIDLSNAVIIETGGMKGRRKELTKEELHKELTKGLNVSSISSEYGMTELLSQAYSQSDGLFSMPPWMKIQLRETNDPFSTLTKSKTGGINVIDLANVYSCSFISTQDLGRIENGQLRLMGRFDQSDIRGCNLLLQ